VWASFFLDAIGAKREADLVMRRLAIALTPIFAVLAFGCADDPEEPNAFQTQGNTTVNDEGTTDTPPQDMANDEVGDGDGDPTTTTTGDGDGDGDPTTTTGDGDGDPTTTTGDGDPNPVCGNATVDDGEQCDGGNLNGFSCTDLGYSGGTLACDPVTCTYDASGCVNDGGTTGGTTG
jgi:hypothetical protein